MTTTAKTILWIIVAIVVIGAIWWWVSMSQTATAPTTGQANQPAANIPTTNINSTASSTTTPGVSATDSSNAALQTDLSNIDTQMNGFSSDNTNVNNGLNDQPVQQSQL